ncbi:MAG: hypothetical protein ACK5L7_02870 [Paludibacteraceae bacterium]
MKKLYPILLFNIFLHSGIRQQPVKLNTNKHAYHSGESTYKYRVKYKDPGSIGLYLRCISIQLETP